MIFKVYTFCVIILFMALGAVGLATERSLVDVKVELPRLFLEIKALELELKKTFKDSPEIKGDYLDRLRSIEKELTSMISQVENLQNRIERIVKDGTNQLSDISFRICELEEGCDISNLSLDEFLGEGLLQKHKNDEDKLITTHGGLTIPERIELQMAKDLIKNGNTVNAIDVLESLLNVHPEGPASLKAKFLLGEALMVNKDWKEAATVYLDIYSSYSSSKRAAEALFLLGRSFEELEKLEESCLMFSQIQIEHQDSTFQKEAYKRSMDLNCQ